ncbi:MAG TPA: alpha/beta fold hydrolase [Steroidobacteraceae bacterium]|jgi:homoserine O-acetyltransferase
MTMRYEKIGDLTLESGRTLKAVQIAFESVGELAPNKENVVLALHGYTSGPDMILPTGEAIEGSWCELIGPGRAIDTDRYFVICPNAIGSTYGSTGPASLSPDSGKPYGASFPSITMRDVVNSQYALLERLGIKQLVAAVGASFGGLQALQWSTSFPSFMRSVVAVLASLGPPPVNVDGIRDSLARDPNWNGGDYYEHGSLVETLVPMRVGMLKNFGVEHALALTIPDPSERTAAIRRRALAWSQGFDANSLLLLMKIMATHDVSTELRKIRARILYVLSRTDPFFPPTLAADALKRLREADVDVSYFELDSEKGHSAATSDAALWAPLLKSFLA